MNDRFVHPERTGEYLRSLQDQISNLRDRNAALISRVRKLEADREKLRARLAQAETRLRRRSVRGLLESLDPRDRERNSGVTSLPGGEVRSHEVQLPDGLGSIPAMTLPEVTPRSNLRAAVILDEFTRTVLSYEMDLVDLDPEHGPEILRRGGVDLVFVESAYAGHRGAWAGHVARFGEPSADLRRITETARNLGIPTVFWNKEDPINADWFIRAAALFDSVFTVDAGMIPLYVEWLGHDRVDVLPFAAQPAIHTPPPDPSDRRGPIGFAGSYYANKHPERRQQMEMLLAPARRWGLHIFDRHAGTDERFLWPEAYRSHIVGSLTYAQTLEMYRRYKVVVNVNTVTSSPTMCARRIFELACCETPIVSGPSDAITRMVPSGIVQVVHDAEEAAAAYQELLDSPTLRGSIGERGRQWILDHHTYEHRINTVVDHLGL